MRYLLLFCTLAGCSDPLAGSGKPINEPAVIMVRRTVADMVKYCNAPAVRYEFGVRRWRDNLRGCAVDKSPMGHDWHESESGRKLHKLRQVLYRQLLTRQSPPTAT